MSDLPEFEDQVPVGVVTSVTGTSQRITRAIHLEDTVLLLVEAETSSIAHKVGQDGLKRHQTLRAKEVWELDDSEETKALLRRCRAEYRLADDAAKGRTSFAVDDSVAPQQYVSVDGVLMTPSEIAAFRGEDWDPDGDLLTVEFADGDRGLWPDDWAESGQSLAGVGSFMRKPNGVPGETHQVVKLIEPESGRVVAEWTDEDEAERSEAEEAQLAVEEAAADREAAEAMPRPEAGDELADDDGDED